MHNILKINERSNTLPVSNWLTTSEFAMLCQITERAVRKAISNKKIKKVEYYINSKGNKAYKIHYSELPHKLLIPILQSKMFEEKQSLLTSIDEYDAESAWNKWQIIEPFFLKDKKCGIISVESGVSVRTLQRWIRVYKKADDGYKMAALARKKRKDKGEMRCISADVERIAAALYLRQTRPSAALIYRQLKEILEISGNLPSQKSITRFLNNLPPKIKVLAREGEKKYRDKFEKLILRDLNSFNVRAIYVGDHHQFDVFVEYRGRLIRPWVSAWMDFRSRCCVGWTIVESPNSDSIALSLRDALLGEKSSFYGIPESLLIDNGKDYRSKRINGEQISFGKIDFKVGAKTVLSELGVNVRLATPYNARAKPIERWFRTIEEQFCRSIPGWCGNKPDNRPEKLQEKLNDFTNGVRGYFCTLEEFRGYFRSWLDIYHTQKHSGLNDMTPAECWQKYAEPPKIPSNQTLTFLLMKHERKIVSNSGIRIFGTKTKHRYYWHQALADYIGMEVDIRFDPQDITKIYIFKDSRFIGIAENRELLGSDAREEDLKAAIREQRKYRKQDKERLAEMMLAWKQSDPILYQAAKRGARDLEKQKRIAVGPSSVYIVPEFEGNMNKKSLKNVSGLRKIDLMESVEEEDSNDFYLDATITESFFRALENGGCKDDQ